MSTSVAKRSAKAEMMAAACAKGRALMGGTAAMRKAGKTYLPKFPAESEAAYSERLALSWLFNGYRKTVRDMAGRVFAKSVEVGEGAPEQLSIWCENIDLAGRDLSTFARAVFEDGVDAGISYIMVDAPPRNGTETQAQAATRNLRPYLIHLEVESILGWKSEPIDNVQTITQLRILEEVHEPDAKDEFAQVVVQQVRVLDRLDGTVQTRIYRKAQSAGSQDEWQLHGEPTFSGLPEITVVPFYANRAGFFAGAPLLDDLADVNIAHWQSQSDQRNILHYARVPILFAAGRTEGEGQTVIAVGQMIETANENAKLTWVEHSGQAIGAGRQDLKDLEFQMEAHGLQLLVAQSQSATGATLDAAKETSILAMTADQLKDALEQALIWMAAYGGLGDVAPEVKVNKEFGAGMMTAQELQLLLNAVGTGDLSRETFLGELARRGMIAPDINVPDEIDRILAEGGGDVVSDIPGATGM
jgi:hypothetical protein